MQISYLISGGFSPYTWSISSGSLPPGIELTQFNQNCEISGIPTSTGIYPFTVQLDYNNGCVITIPQALIIQCNTIIIQNQLVVPTYVFNGDMISNDYNDIGIVGTATWGSYGDLPPGLILNSSTGLLSGTITGSATQLYSFVIYVVDSNDNCLGAVLQEINIKIS